MDDRFDRENEYSDTRYPRRESSSIDGNTRYPVREERRPLRSSHQEQTCIPKKEESVTGQNSFAEYGQRAAARRAEFTQECSFSYFQGFQSVCSQPYQDFGHAQK